MSDIDVQNPTLS